MTRQLCTFRVGPFFYGVDVLDVQEVISAQPLTRVPLASRELRGLINLRGQIVAAIDLRRRLGFDDADPDGPPMNVVVRVGGNAVSFLVDEIGDVVEIDETLASAIPDTVPESARRLVTEVHKFDHELLHVIDAVRAAALPAETGAGSR
jgi:purine-binding chemotaxis protein CheW